MEDASLLVQAFVYLIAAVISVPIAKRLGLGSVLGYLIAGAIIGPFGLGLLGEPENVMHVAEFGVVIMLFLIGLEIRPSLLWRMRASILGLGGGQVVLTGIAIAAIGLGLGLDWRTAVACGAILALASTAIVLQSLREKGWAATPPGRSAFAVLLFQDIAVIPMLALLPLLAVSGLSGVEAAGHDQGTALAELPEWAQPLAVVSAVAVIVVGGRVGMRPVFRYIASTGLREIFTAAALMLVVGVALLMEAVGLSAALGAFLAGVVLADSEFRHELEADIEPFRGLLLGLFFISVGASVDFALLLADPLLILGVTVGVIALKGLVLYVLGRGFRQTRADAAVLALSLAQVGEFAFVLFAFATQNGIVAHAVADPLVAVVALSMAATPLLFIAAERLAERLSAGTEVHDHEPIEPDSPHALIVGFGRFGQTVGRLLMANGFRTSVLDYSADQIEMLRGFGVKANYGDASRVDLLEAAGAEDAQILVIAVDDTDKILEIAETARSRFPHLKVLARAFDRRHAYELMKLGVHGFERETFEGGIALGVEALRHLGMRAHQAMRAGRLFRRHDHRLMQQMSEYWDDEHAYRIQSRARSGDVDRLLRRDLDVFGTTHVDDAWDTESLDRENEATASSQADDRLPR